MTRTTSTLFLLAASAIAAAWIYTGTLAFAGGDKDITEGYVLCERDGVATVTLEEDGITAVIDCSAVPGPDAQD